MLIALPSENVASGIVIDPPEPTCTYLPTSPVASVYEPVFVPTAGMLLKPTAFVPSTVQLESVPDEGVPRAPPFVTNAPAEPTLTARAVATLVPKPDTPVEIGRPVQLVNVPLEGVPNAPPFTTKAPEEPVFTPSAVTTPVPVVTVEGAAPAPPPTIKALAVSALELAQAEELEKYGTPPEVPATVSAKVPDVVTGEPATEINPPVNDCATDVTVPFEVDEATFTKSLSLQATTHFSPETIVTPAVGPAPRNTMEPVPALITTYVLLFAGAVTFLVVAPLLAVHRIMACRAWLAT